MKKTLLFTAIAIFATMALSAQVTKVWVLGNDITHFPVNAGIGNGTGTEGNPAFPVTIDGLAITGISTNVNMGQVEASSKTFGTDTYINRFKLNGAGYPGAAAGQLTPTVSGVDYYMPTQRYLSISVGGNSTITVRGITGSTGSERIVFVTNGVSLVGSLVALGDATMCESVINYTGPATTLYLYGNASVNLYYLSVTNFVETSVKSVLADKGVTYNGTEITNNNGLNIEVYNAIGKRVANSKTNISTANFQKGVYVVRISGTNDALKIMI